MSEICIIELNDSTSLRCPAFPADCDQVSRVYATGETYKLIEAAKIAADPASSFLYLLADPGTPVVEGDDYGRELVTELADGRAIRCPAEACEGFWVRIVSADGEEEAYWDEDEFNRDPEVVLGALLGAARVATEIVPNA